MECLIFIEKEMLYYVHRFIFFVNPNRSTLQDIPIETVYKTVLTFQWVHYDF